MKSIFLIFVKFYRNYLSGLKMRSCRYYPTCSEYMHQAILKKGAFKGILIGAWRIVRCNPFSPGGYDPLQ